MYRCLFGPEDLSNLLETDFLSCHNPQAPAEWFLNLYEDKDFPDEVTRAQYHDLMTYLPDDLMVKTDTASMACSLEVRGPFLDHNLVEAGLSLPLGLKLNTRRGKLLLRQAFADLLPRQVLNRPKRGFGVPLGRWLREDLASTVKETLLDKSFLGLGIFRPKAIETLICQHVNGLADHRHRIWALLFLGRWLAMHRQK